MKAIIVITLLIFAGCAVNIKVPDDPLTGLVVSDECDLPVESKHWVESTAIWIKMVVKTFCLTKNFIRFL